MSIPRGHSSAGRAPGLQPGGQGFDSPWLHQFTWLRSSVWLERPVHTRQVEGSNPPAATIIDALPAGHTYGFLFPRRAAYIKIITTDP